MSQMHETQPFAGHEPAPVAASSGLSPTMAAALAYVFGLIGGVVILLIEKHRYARFHAAQSILCSAAWVVGWIAIMIVSTALSFLPFVGALVGWMLGMLLWMGLGLGGLALWVVLIVKAVQGKEFRLPVIGKLAEDIAFR